MFRVLLLVALSFVLHKSYAQQPILEWARQFGASVLEDTYNDNGRSVVVDAAGNVYSAGLFFNVVDFDPGPGNYNLTAIGGAAIYISALSSTGTFLWAKQIGVSPSFAPRNITIDAMANIYLTTYFGGYCTCKGMC